MKKEPVIKVVKVEPGKAPKVIEMKNELEAMQEIVGGYIEVYPLVEDIAIVCNEEGKMIGLPLNRAVYDNNGNIADIMAGTFFVAKDDFESGEFVSLTDDQVKEVMEYFEHPQMFFKVGGKIAAVPVPPME